MTKRLELLMYQIALQSACEELVKSGCPLEFPNFEDFMSECNGYANCEMKECNIVTCWEKTLLCLAKKKLNEIKEMGYL